MSVPKEKLHQLVELISDENSDEIVAYLEEYIQKKLRKEEFDPTQYIGILDDIDFDIEEECTKMREEWDGRGWDSTT